MRRSHSDSDTSVGLFAFLDVLMSTMGSLILVLMIVSPKIRQEKIAKAATEAAREVVKVEPAPVPKPPPPVAELPREVIDLNAKFATRVAELSAQAEEKRRSAADAQRALLAARDSSQKTHADRTELEQKVEQIRDAKNRTLASVEDLSAEAVKVETELLGRRSRLRKIRDQIAHQSTEYSFVAYDGVSGTTRRPILIECADEQIKFVQENIVLTSREIVGFTAAVNPLLAGSRALIDYWSANSPANEPKPYVLMVVRPSGTMAYYRARNLLQHLRAPFGYELLPEDQKLSAPRPDPQAVAACRDAINQAIAKRDSVFDQVFATNSGYGGRKAGLRGGGGSGTDTPGLAGSGGPPNSPFDDPFDFGSNGSKGTGKGPGNDPNGAAGNIATGNTASGNAATGSAGTGDAVAGRAAGDLASTKGMGTGNSTGPNQIAAMAGKPAGSSLGSPGTGSPGTGSSGLGSSGTGLPGTGSPGTVAAMGSAGAGAEPGTGAGANSGMELLPSLEPAGGPPNMSAAGTGSQSKPDELTLPALDDGVAQAGAPQSEPSTLGLGSPLSSPLLQAGMAPAQGAMGQAAPAGGAAPSQPSLTGLMGPPQVGVPQLLPPLGITGSQGQSGQPGGSPGGSSDGAESSGDPGQSSPGSAEDGGGMPSFARGSEDPTAPRGPKHRWGYSSSQSSIGFEHDVTIRIGARSIVVGGQPPIAINGGESSARLAALVVPALDRDAQTWGRPPDHLYWVPSIRFVVCPGGNLPYERLWPALARHGLVSSVDYELEMGRPPQSLESWMR
jgi:hypothetical protein